MKITQKQIGPVNRSQYSRSLCSLLDSLNRHNDLWVHAIMRDTHRPSWTIGGIIGLKKREVLA